MKKALAIAMVLIMLFTLVGCSSTGGNETPSGNDVPQGEGISGFDYTLIDFLANYDEFRYQDEINILYLVCTTFAEYFPASHAVWEPMLAEHNIKIDLLGPPNYTDESLIATLESALVTGKYDAVILYPITPQAITPMLDIVWDNYNIPIISYAFSPDTGSGHYYMGTSYYHAGTVLGESIIDYVDKNKDYFDTLDTIPVAVYKNSAGAEQYKRIVGAMDVLKADGRFSLIDEFEANGEAVCLAATETLLTAHPNVEVILTQIDNSAVGTYQTVNSGVYPNSEYLSIWGYDATGAVMSLMAQDGVDGYVQGSSFIDHQLAGQAIIEFVPIVVGAAKQGELLEFKKDEFDFLAELLASYYVTVTPENVSNYYKK